MVDRQRRAIAALHAGWRGTVQRIAEIGVHRMHSEFGSRPEDLSAAIGPCIGSCCYEVGQEVRHAFSGRFAYAETLFTAVEKGNSGPSLHLDLVEANRRQLLTAGLDRASIHVVEGCTACRPDRFFSYRKSGGSTGRLMSVIGLLC
jgi:YfiH family protein